jgi:hypothetical protein
MKCEALREACCEELRIDYDGKEIIWRELPSERRFSLPFSTFIPSDFYLYAGLLRFSKSLLDSTAVSENFRLTLGSEVEKNPRIRDAALSQADYLKRTQTLLNQLNAKKTAQRGKILFYTLENHEMLNAYAERAKKMAPDRVVIKSFSTGWNPLTRAFEKPNLMEPSDFISFCLENNITKIISNNAYYPELCLKYFGIILLPALHAAGLEFSSVDFDVPDYMGYLNKMAYSDERSRRYGMYPHFQEYWDRTYNFQNVRYITGDYIENAEQPVRPLKDSYKVLIASNARIQDVIPPLVHILWALEKTSSENTVSDFQFWYYALRHMIQDISSLSLQEREHMNTSLWKFYLHVISFLKYETIESLRTDREVLLFGDPGWSELFPDRFQGRFVSDREYVEMIQSDQYLALHLNANYSYLENNPVVQRALRFGSPFLGYPAVVCTPRWEGFRAIEYRNAIELRDKIDLANECFQNPKFLESRQMHMSLIKKSVDENLDDFLTQGDTGLHHENSFLQESRNHQRLFTENYHRYLSKNIEQLKVDLHTFFFSKVPPFQMESSRFSQRSYVKKLWELRSKFAN